MLASTSLSEPSLLAINLQPSVTPFVILVCADLWHLLDPEPASSHTSSAAESGDPILF